MWGWLIALGVLLLLAILPLGISAIYNTDGLRLRLIAGPVRLTVFPGKKKKPEKKASKEKTAKSAATASQPSKQGGSLTDFLPLVKHVLGFLGELHRKIRVKRLEMKLILGGGDPCDLAVNYGKAWAAVGSLIPHLENYFIIKKRDVEVECDFTADTTLVFARLDLTITLGRLLSLGIRHGIRVLREFMKITNQRKGGANT